MAKYSALMEQDKGIANGVATLGADGKLAIGQLPENVATISGGKVVPMPTAADVKARSNTWLPTLQQVRGSNTNLLDNAWFQINQRGMTSYTAQGYTVDRWRNYHASGSTITVDSTYGGLRIANTRASETYAQQFFDRTLEAGKEYTMSAYVYVIAGDARLRVFAGSTTRASTSATTKTGAWEYITTKFTAQGDETSITLTPSASSTAIFRAVKLEVGSSNTLMYDTYPNYQQELAKCQRYYYRALGNVGHVAIGVTTATGYLTAQLPVPMKSRPSISGIVKLYPSNIEITTLSVASPSKTADFDGVTIYLENATGLTANRPYICTAGTDFALTCEPTA